MWDRGGVTGGPGWAPNQHRPSAARRLRASLKGVAEVRARVRCFCLRHLVRGEGSRTPDRCVVLGCHMQSI